MKKLILGVALACVALASDDPKNIDDRVMMAGLEGTWRVYSGEDDGHPIPAAQFQNSKLIFKRANTATLIDMGDTQTIIYRADPTRHPAHLDLTMSDGPNKGETLQMIYSVDGNTLKIALFSLNRSVRPTEFKTGQDSKMRILILKRASN